MPENTLVADIGRPIGSRPSNRLRHVGRVPGVVYGNGVGPLTVSVERRLLRTALSGPAGLNSVIELAVDGAVHPVVVKDLQRDPVRRAVTHVDFLVVNLLEDIEVEVPVVLVGHSKAIEDAGGLVDQQLQTLTVSTTPRNIPNEISVDVSELELGDHVTVADITLPAGVTTPLDPDTIIVTTILPRGEPEAEVAAGEEGEGADAASADGESAE
ncbi:MAG: large subunit ribosomal protein [Acidimicrobiaceae bacterium]|jgi:large subunit ribosomal protein L25|nr:large subunit ribosomal protein [Acidimicrobiaceae bacterium]